MGSIARLLGGAATTKSIVNAFSANGCAGVVFTPTAFSATARAMLSGALDANVLATALEITGMPGTLDIAAITSVDATARTHRMRITIDGKIDEYAFDSTSASVAQADAGMVAVGAATAQSSTTKTVVPTPKPFRKSCKVEFASSLPETDKTNVYIAYTTKEF